MNKQTQLLRDVRFALQRGDFVGALASLEKVAKLAEEQEAWGAAGRHLGNLALTYYRLGNIKQALQYFEQALDFARRDGDHMTENGLLGNMGNILRESKRFDDAITYLNDALRLAQQLGDTRGRGIWLTNLGLVYDDLRQPEDAIPLHQEAVRIAREMHDETARYSRLINLGNSYEAQGDYLSAAQQFQQVLAIDDAHGKREEVAYRTGVLGNLYAEAARQQLPADAAYAHFSTALDYYGKAMNLMRAIGDQASEAEVIRSIGDVLADAGQYDDAKQYLDVAQQMFSALGLTQQATASKTTLKRLIEFLEQDQA